VQDCLCRTCNQHSKEPSFERKSKRRRDEDDNEDSSAADSVFYREWSKQDYKDATKELTGFPPQNISAREKVHAKGTMDQPYACSLDKTYYGGEEGRSPIAYRTSSGMCVVM
jgi:hypothetical protein